MKKFFVSVITLSMVLGFAGLSVQAVSSDSTKDRGYIAVNAASDMEIAPDVAEIAFAVKTSDTKSMQKATAINKEISDKVYADLRAMINPAVGDYIKTSDFNASPIYSYSGQKRNLDKYEVSNRVIVHTKSIDKLGVMIDNALSAGATNVDSLSFSISNYDTQCDELIAKAAKKAYNRANLLARVMNTSLNGISSLNTSCSSNNSSRQPKLYMAKNMLAGVSADTVEGASTGMSISNGVIKINANVNVSFFVK